MSTRFYFQVFNEEKEKIAIHDVPIYLAKTKDECWQAFGIGLVDYSKSYMVELIDAGEQIDND